MDMDQANTMRPMDAPNPAGTGVLGMWLFLSSLTMLFLAAIGGYVIIRLTGRYSPVAGVIHVPALLWASTLLVLGCSVAIQRALMNVRRQRLERFRQALGAALLLAGAFLAVQTPALVALLREHESLRASNIHLYGLMFMLILLHALHVAGGLIPLVVTCAQARRGRYDHEHHAPVRYLAMYWHFLDLVWVVMFTTFLALG